MAIDCSFASGQLQGRVDGDQLVVGLADRFLVEFQVRRGGIEVAHFGGPTTHQAVGQTYVHKGSFETPALERERHGISDVAMVAMSIGAVEHDDEVGCERR